jgi:hypothetical protein
MFCDINSIDSIQELWGNDKLEGEFDLIVEDGPHTYDSNVLFLQHSLKKLKAGGIYITEDIDISNFDRMKLFKDSLPSNFKTFLGCVNCKLVTNPSDDILLFVQRVS